MTGEIYAWSCVMTGSMSSGGVWHKSDGWICWNSRKHFCKFAVSVFKKRIVPYEYSVLAGRLPESL